MGDLNFPEDCKTALTEALARKAQKYHLLPSVKTACDGDVKQYCNQSAAAVASDPLLARLAFYNAPGGGDGQGDSQAAPTSNERKQDRELLCLSVNLGSLSNSCRQEMAMEIHQQLLVYMPGMPLTAACDEDAKKLCDAGEAQVVATLAVLAAKLLGLVAGSAVVWCGVVPWLIVCHQLWRRLYAGSCTRKPAFTPHMSGCHVNRTPAVITAA